ncbi:hypothetical protein, partial [Microbacterium sp. NPDC057650]|uniref:hypothetical protein n=1 Tax=Microbacterium sp. NPDC057650 TaxID=3346193 RepID=UPI0036709391
RAGRRAFRRSLRAAASRMQARMTDAGRISGVSACGRPFCLQADTEAVGSVHVPGEPPRHGCRHG